ncbi:MAG: hypothetical protein HY300_16690, partial [Verrucomicrobia bacterium]|nr:hypothetical protein [Verrucomicrobiota bacterium]
LMTPTRDESGGVELVARLVEVPESALETLGFNGLVTDARAAERFFTMSSDAAAELIRSLEQMAGVDLLTGPRIRTRPGGEAMISIGNNADTEEISIGFTPQVQPDGNSLDMTMKVRLPQPKAKTDQ